MGKGKQVSEEKRLEIQEKWLCMADHLNERGKRIGAASEARALGWGGITCVSNVTGMARSAIQEGLEELAHPEQAAPVQRVRRGGGGRKKNEPKIPPV